MWVASYISRLNSLSQKVSLHCREHFHFLCFMGDNADIDYIFDFAISLNVFSDKFITDSNSAISHYKNFNPLYKTHNNKEYKAIDYETFMKIAKNTLLSNAAIAIGINKNDCE